MTSDKGTTKNESTYKPASNTVSALDTCWGNPGGDKV